jgi:proteic killer suppression protein
VIKSFKCRDTEKLASGIRVRRFVNIERAAQRKLAIIDSAATLEDVRIPPANRLEKLAGNRVGQYSIRINDQWRICFEWREGHAYEVEIVDYH